MDKKQEIFDKVQALAIQTNHKMQESFVGKFRSAFLGEGFDYAESKVFSDGDNVKHIDWKTSAKTGKLFVKKFEETRKLKINLLVDNSISLQTGFSDLKKNKLIEAFALIVFSALKSGDRISLKFLSEGIEENGDLGEVFGSGKKFSFKVLEKILSEKFDKIEINYEKFFENFNSNKKNNNSIIFIFSDFEDENLLKNIEKINPKNEIICVFIRDNLEKILKNNFAKNGISEFEDFKTGEKILIDWKKFGEFKKFLDADIFEKRKKLAKFGIESLEVFEEKSVMDDFAEFFATKKRRKRK
ncbi:DUF58 domain-containing protein [Candidatus Gracilibacteria bacterium]|nr:DUF58 domain-containing protein [Candidatus Gracilibacteria bacterium]